MLTIYRQYCDCQLCECVYKHGERSQKLKSHVKYSGGGRSTLKTKPKLSSVLDLKVFSELGSSKTPKFNETVLLGWVSPLTSLLFGVFLVCFFFVLFSSPPQQDKTKTKPKQQTHPDKQTKTKKSSYTHTFEDVTESCCPLLLFDIFKCSKRTLRSKVQKVTARFCSTLYPCCNLDLPLTEPVYPYVTRQFHFCERQHLPKKAFKANNYENPYKKIILLNNYVMTSVNIQDNSLHPFHF